MKKFTVLLFIMALTAAFAVGCRNHNGSGATLPSSLPTETTVTEDSIPGASATAPSASDPASAPTGPMTDGMHFQWQMG